MWGDSTWPSDRHAWGASEPQKRIARLWLVHIELKRLRFNDSQKRQPRSFIKWVSAVLHHGRISNRCLIVWFITLIKYDITKLCLSTDLDSDSTRPVYRMCSRLLSYRPTATGNVYQPLSGLNMSHCNNGGLEFGPCTGYNVKLSLCQQWGLWSTSVKYFLDVI